MSFRFSRRRSLAAIGGLLASAGCVSWGSPSSGILQIETDGVGYSVDVTVASTSEAVIDATYALAPGEPVHTSFVLEADAEYDVNIDFEPRLRDVHVGDAATERGWTTDAREIRGEVAFSSSDRVYTVSVDGAGVATIEYVTDRHAV
ncbi:hypothetical protein [Halobacterium hubeiense]|uniref:hypothetical protein n=1 Tax=Halobacterium hubeiense TaxID=1407499 RepID=UPI003C712E51